MELKFEKFKTCEIDEEAHNLVKELHKKTGVKVKYIISKCVVDSILSRKKILEEDNNGQCSEDKKEEGEGAE